jgi:hypothetical protein
MQQHSSNTYIQSIYLWVDTIYLIDGIIQQFQTTLTSQNVAGELGWTRVLRNGTTVHCHYWLLLLWRPLNVRSDEFSLTTKTSCFNSVLVSGIHLSSKSYQLIDNHSGVPEFTRVHPPHFVRLVLFGTAGWYLLRLRDNFRMSVSETIVHHSDRMRRFSYPGFPPEIDNWSRKPFFNELGYSGMVRQFIATIGSCCCGDH